MKNTETVITELKELLNTKGFIYSFCLILFEDFHHDMNKIHEVDYRSKLSVKECSLIIGFLVQSEIDFSMPASPEETLILKGKTYEIMKDLQSSFNASFIPKFEEMIKRQEAGEEKEDTFQDKLDFFVKDNGMVEPMFYAGDGVYDFQYLEYLEHKYKYDRDWLVRNRKFEIDTNIEIVKKIKKVLELKSKKVRLIDLKKDFAKLLKKTSQKMRKEYSREEIEEFENQQLTAATFFQYVQLFPHVNEIEDDFGSWKASYENILDSNNGNIERDNSEDWKKFYENLLDLFVITPADIEGVDEELVEAFFQNFSFTPVCNKAYNGPGYFNIVNSQPLIKLENERYFVPVNYLVAEAVYESPFYWMWDDKKYRSTLAMNRGIVGEEIAYDFLYKVFGKENTFKSVIVEIQKGKTATDIDVLCILGNKAICVQVKSKKLTLNAKRGDFDQLTKDFNGAVQDAYNQGLVSRDALLDNKARFFDENRNELFLSSAINEVYILGITTENYPSLVHQVHMMLVKEEKDPFPLFLSVFDLELLVHYLNDPYDFLYYVRQRIDLIEYFRADEEIIYLGYHLHRRLFEIEGHNWVMLDTDFGGLIDRNYYPIKTGITHLLSESDDPLNSQWRDAGFDSFLKEIKLSGHPKTTEIVFHLLDWSGDSRKGVIEKVIDIKHISKIERKNKTLATASAPYFGLSCVVLNAANPQDLENRTLRYAILRKYLLKCDVWVGIGTFADSPNLINCLVYNDEVWQNDIEFENENKDILARMETTPRTPITAVQKVSRNALCPCNSGKKYKRCCGK